jgi:hypothetical protein
MRFSPRERGPGRFVGRCWPAHLRGWTLILWSLVKPRFLLAVLDLLHAPSQRFAEDRPTPIDLPQAGVAAALGDGD